MTIWRARVSVDLLYKAQEPLAAPHLVMIANRVGSYLRTGAVEGLDNVDVVFDKSEYNQHAHHHDARFERCRADHLASMDDLGPIE